MTALFWRGRPRLQQAASWAGTRRRAGLACASLMGAVLASGCALLPQPAAEIRAAGAAPALRLEVDAPAALKPLLEKHLDLAKLQAIQSLQSQQGDEAIDGTEWARLIGVAPTQARDLLQTEGYFEAQVTVQRLPGAADGAAQVPPPAASQAASESASQAASQAAPQVQQVRLKVNAGPRTEVASLRVTTSGALSQRVTQGDADAAALDTLLPKVGTLQVGQPFRNSDWADTKQQQLARLRAGGYAAATLSDSQADIDVPTHRADLRVALDSGPLFLAGGVQVEGLKHQDEVTVQNLAGFGPGTPLTEARLLDYQERLQKSGLFESAVVAFEPDVKLAEAAPVRVRVSEWPLQQATVGLGISANIGPRATLEHTHRRPFNLPVTAYNKFVWGRSTQSWAGDYQTHPGEGFYRSLVGVQIERVLSATDVVLSQRLRLGRTQDTITMERLYFAELLRSRQSERSGDTPVNTATAVSGNYQWVWRQLDNVLLPTRGITLALQSGAGEAGSPGGASGAFARLYGRLTGYLPLGNSWYGQARVEAGQIFKSDKVNVPDALGFRAGGDDSVRGYAYRSLAPTSSLGNVTSGQSLLTGSVEVAHPIVASLPSVWGALFIDAGRAVDHWGDYRAAIGYGAGVRWRSPIGPLRVDLAWADELRKLRLHLSVGIAF